MYKVIGWGIPSIPILIWSILMHQSNPIHEELRSDDVISSMCWISDVGNWIDWLRRGPILFILAFNLLILLHIIKILICSQIRNGQDSNQLIKVRIICLPGPLIPAKQYSQAAKATLILSPLLGITYLLFLYNPGNLNKCVHICTNLYIPLSTLISHIQPKARTKKKIFPIHQKRL